MEKGYIKLYRKIKDSKLYKEKRRFSRSEAWIELLLLANHKPTTILVGLTNISLKAGDVFTSQLKLSKKWKWGRTSVNRFLFYLKNEHQITYKADTKFTIISILNWQKYQGNMDIKRIPKRTSNGHQTDTINNVKECKRINNIVCFFKEETKRIRDLLVEVPNRKNPVYRRIVELLTRKENPLSEEDLKGLITFYLESDKCKKFGVSFAAAFNDHTINQWRQYGEDTKNLYAN